MQRCDEYLHPEGIGRRSWFGNTRGETEGLACKNNKDDDLRMTFQAVMELGSVFAQTQDAGLEVSQADWPGLYSSARWRVFAVVSSPFKDQRCRMQ